MGAKGTRGLGAFEQDFDANGGRISAGKGHLFGENVVGERGQMIDGTGGRIGLSRKDLGGDAARYHVEGGILSSLGAGQKQHIGTGSGFGSVLCSGQRDFFWMHPTRFLVRDFGCELSSQKRNDV